jgi:hypothetical protein
VFATLLAQHALTPEKADTSGPIEGNVASCTPKTARAARSNTRNPDAAMTGKWWLRRRVNFWEGRGSKPHRFRHSGPRGRPRLPTGQAQRTHHLLRISGHVMPFPPHSCINRHQSGNSGPASARARSKEHSASHVVRDSGHHEVVNAKPNGRTNEDEHPEETPQGGTRSAIVSQSPTTE